MAETLLSPFGDDDEDLDINYLINRNVQVRLVLQARQEQEASSKILCDRPSTAMMFYRGSF